MPEITQADSATEWTFSPGPDHVDIPKLVWTDPPFGTAKIQRGRTDVYRDVTPDESVELTVGAIRNIPLAWNSVVCVCSDYRSIHHIIVELSKNLHFQGEIIWTFGLGRPRTSWWPVRHNTIATFTVDPATPWFDPDAVPREPRKAKKAGYPDDKPAGSVWDRTMSNTDPERVGYPNQKPLSIIEPFILAHTKPGDLVADPFCGSGTTGVAAVKHGRRFQGQDLSSSAVELAAKRIHETDHT